MLQSVLLLVNNQELFIFMLEPTMIIMFCSSKPLFRYLCVFQYASVHSHVVFGLYIVNRGLTPVTLAMVVKLPCFAMVIY